MISSVKCQFWRVKGLDCKLFFSSPLSLVISAGKCFYPSSFSTVGFIYSLSVYTWQKTCSGANMTCVVSNHLKCKLHRQVFMCKVGHCLVAWGIWPDLCPFNKILIARIFNGDVKKTFYSSSELSLDEKWKSFPNNEQNLLIITTLILGVMVFFLWLPNVWFLAVKHVCLAPIRTCFFVTCQHSDATDSNHRHLSETIVASLLQMYFSNWFIKDKVLNHSASHCPPLVEIYMLIFWFASLSVWLPFFDCLCFGLNSQ